MKTAVILAARKERDTEVPYPLHFIDNDESVTLLDRTLSILRDNGISDIIIVTGYKASLFEKYKAPDVRLVYNRLYPYTSSMASLAEAAPLINDDFLLIESDIIFEKKVVAKLIASPHSDCFTVVSECGNGDEAFVETEGGCLLKISKDSHQFNHIDGEMIGITKISHHTFRRMMLRWERNTNPRLNYEYLMLDATGPHERHFIKPRDLSWCEADNASEFNYLKDYVFPTIRRKEDPFDRQNILAHLADVFPDIRLSDDTPIEYIGGMTNRNFKVTVEGSEYVIRIPGNGTEGMVERINEERNSILANRMGINPDIRYINEKTGIKVTDFIPEAETLGPATIQRPDNMDKVAEIFRTLHNSEVRLNNEFNVFHEIINFEHLMEKAGAVMYDGYEEIRPKVMQLSDRLNALGVSLRPCHNDLVPENFIKDRTGRLFLIDWEYSGMNDPMLDMAALLIESEFSDDNRDYILEQYFRRPASDTELEKIKIYQVLLDILWSIWTVIKEKQGDDFGGYGPMRFNRARRQLSELLSAEK